MGGLSVAGVAAGNEKGFFVGNFGWLSVKCVTVGRSECTRVCFVDGAFVGLSAKDDTVGAHKKGLFVGTDGEDFFAVSELGDKVGVAAVVSGVEGVSLGSSTAPLVGTFV